MTAATRVKRFTQVNESDVRLCADLILKILKTTIYKLLFMFHIPPSHLASLLGFTYTAEF